MKRENRGVTTRRLQTAGQSDAFSDSQLTVRFEEFVNVGEELQQPVQVVLGGAALQHREEEN